MTLSGPGEATSLWSEADKTWWKLSIAYSLPRLLPSFLPGLFGYFSSPLWRALFFFIYGNSLLFFFFLFLLNLTSLSTSSLLDLLLIYLVDLSSSCTSLFLLNLTSLSTRSWIYYSDAFWTYPFFLYTSCNPLLAPLNQSSSIKKKNGGERREWTWIASLPRYIFF